MTYDDIIQVAGVMWNSVKWWFKKVAQERHEWKKLEAFADWQTGLKNIKKFKYRSRICFKNKFNYVFLY